MTNALADLRFAGRRRAAADRRARHRARTWVSYLVAAALFILSLKWLSHPRTARRGVRAGEIGMALAIIGTLLMFHVGYKWVLIGIVLGSLIGAPMAIWMPMTAVPQRTALSHAFGALAAALVGIAHYYDPHGGDARPLHDGRPGARGAARQPHVHRQPRGVRQAAGADPQLDQRPAQPEPHQLLAARRGAACAASGSSFNPAHYFVFLLLIVLGAGVRPVPGDADRRGRHADRDLAA